MAEDHWSIRRAEQGGVSEIAQVGWQNSSAPDVAELRFLVFFVALRFFSDLRFPLFFVSHFALCCNFSATRNHYTACRNSGKMSFLRLAQASLSFLLKPTCTKGEKFCFHCTHNLQKCTNAQIGARYGQDQCNAESTHDLFKVLRPYNLTAVLIFGHFPNWRGCRHDICPKFYTANKFTR